MDLLPLTKSGKSKNFRIFRFLTFSPFAASCLLTPLKEENGRGRRAGLRKRFKLSGSIVYSPLQTKEKLRCWICFLLMNIEGFPSRRLSWMGWYPISFSQAQRIEIGLIWGNRSSHKEKAENRRISWFSAFCLKRARVKKTGKSVFVKPFRSPSAAEWNPLHHAAVRIAK